MAYILIALHDLAKASRSARCFNAVHSEICEEEIKIFFEQFFYKDRKFIPLDARCISLRKNTAT
jgi:hypothetical protein